MRNYQETYEYDPLGNFLALGHLAAKGSWSRTYRGSYRIPRTRRLYPSEHLASTGLRYSLTECQKDKIAGQIELQALLYCQANLLHVIPPVDAVERVTLALRDVATGPEASTRKLRITPLLPTISHANHDFHKTPFYKPQ
jgi:hypothetical protein